MNIYHVPTSDAACCGRIHIPDSQIHKSEVKINMNNVILFQGKINV